MLVPILFILALGGTNVVAEPFWKHNDRLPWSFLYTATGPENNKGHGQWSEEIDISNHKTWKNENVKTDFGERRRSLWLPAKDNKHAGKYCFMFYKSTDGYGDHDTAQVEIETDHPTCWNFDAQLNPDPARRKRSRSRKWQGRQEQNNNDGDNLGDGGQNGNSDQEFNNNQNEEQNGGGGNSSQSFNNDLSSSDGYIGQPVQHSAGLPITGTKGPYQSYYWEKGPCYEDITVALVMTPG